jgi:hypothetical protein
MSDERTPWYPSGVAPVRRGVYERNLGTIGIRFAYWTGKFWGGFATEHRHAVQNQYAPTGHEDAPWRGLARKPR